MLFREYCVSRISICLTNERVQSFNIIERRWWSRENYYLYRLYCCLLSTIVLPVNYSRDHHQIIICTRYRWYFMIGGEKGERERDSMCSYVLKIKAIELTILARGIKRGGALRSCKSLNFNFKLNSRVESWVSA